MYYVSLFGRIGKAGGFAKNILDVFSKADYNKYIPREGQAVRMCVFIRNF